MGLGQLGMKDAEHARSKAPEADQDPLPVPDGPWDWLWTLWTFGVAVPLAFAIMGAVLAVAIPLALVLPVSAFQRRGPQQVLGLVPYLAPAWVRVQHHPDFRRDQPAILAMNHTSMLDAFVAARAIPHRMCGIHHAHHFEVPLYGEMMRMAGSIGVERGASGQHERVAAEVQERASRGISVLTLPEGRRTQNGRILPLRTGVFRIARDAGLPVVPVAVRGLWRVMRRGTSIMRPGLIEVYVGAPLSTEGLDDEGIQALADEVRAELVEWVEGPTRP